MGQIYLLDVFLEGQFRRYGPLVSAFALEEKPYDRVDPMARLFPKMTKCTIHTFGPAGSVQTHDALCVLPLNVVNEKIFVVLWFWLVFLAGVGLLAVIYRCARGSVRENARVTARRSDYDVGRCENPRFDRARHVSRGSEIRPPMLSQSSCCEGEKLEIMI